MLLTITKQVTEEIEVEGEFPLFFKRSGAYYKVLNEKEHIEVYTASNLWKPSILHSTVKSITGAVIEDGERIKENQFVDEFVKAFYSMYELVKQPAASFELELAKAS